METNIREESGLKFGFPKKSTVIKFDDTRFYQEYFNKLPETKGVDFISVDKDKIAFIEVKVFQKVLDKFFRGERDQKTVEILRG